MTGELRDELAALAMTGLIGEGFFTHALPAGAESRPTYQRLARMSYEIADAMVWARIGVTDCRLPSHVGERAFN